MKCLWKGGNDYISIWFFNDCKIQGVFQGQLKNNSFQGVFQSPGRKIYNSRSFPGIPGAVRTLLLVQFFSSLLKYLELSHSGRLTGRAVLFHFLPLLVKRARNWMIPSHLIKFESDDTKSYFFQQAQKLSFSRHINRQTPSQPFPKICVRDWFNCTLFLLLTKRFCDLRVGQKVFAQLKHFVNVNRFKFYHPFMEGTANKKT